jgi:hypothetical protein
MVRAVPAPNSIPAPSSSTGPKQLVFTDQVGAAVTDALAHEISRHVYYWGIPQLGLDFEHAVRQLGLLLCFRQRLLVETVETGT